MEPFGALFKHYVQKVYLNNDSQVEEEWLNMDQPHLSNALFYVSIRGVHIRDKNEQW